MADTESCDEYRERRSVQITETGILLKLTEILEREHFITIAERNRAIGLIEKGGMI